MRYIDEFRRDKLAPFTANFEINQAIRIAHERGPEALPLEMVSGSEQTPVPLNQIQTLKAPVEPQFFEIRQGEQLLLTGAAHFADTREADFSGAASKNELEFIKGEAETEHTRRDDAWQIWLLLFLAAILLSWYFINRKAITEPEGAGATPHATSERASRREVGSAAEVATDCKSPKPTTRKRRVSCWFRQP